MASSSTSPLRILLWSPNGSGLHYGGPGMMAYRLYSKAVPGRFEVTLVHGNPKQADYPLFRRQHLIAPLDKLNIRQQWTFVHRGQRWIDEHAKEFDIFHGLQGFHLTVGPAFRAQRKNLPAAVMLATYNNDLADKTGWKRLLALPKRRRRMLRELGGIVAISDAIADELLGFGFPEEKIARIPIGVDTDHFRPPVNESERRQQRAELGWPDRPTIIIVGNVTRNKNALLLVEALGMIQRRGIDAQLAIVGPEDDPPFAAEIRTRAAELKLTDRVIWAGFTTDPAPLFRAADVFSLPSASEGMPSSLVEALASGLPAVTTAISGATDLVRDGITGRLIERRLEPAAEALASYLDSPDLARAHGQAGRDIILQRCSATAVLDAHERLFRRIMTMSRIRE